MYTVYNSRLNVYKIVSTIEEADKLKAQLTFAYDDDFYIKFHEDVWSIYHDSR